MQDILEPSLTTSCARCGKNLKLIPKRSIILTEAGSFCSPTCQQIEKESVGTFKLSRAFGNRSPFKPAKVRSSHR